MSFWKRSKSIGFSSCRLREMQKPSPRASIIFGETVEKLEQMLCTFRLVGLVLNVVVWRFDRRRWFKLAYLEIPGLSTKPYFL